MPNRVKARVDGKHKTHEEVHLLHDIFQRNRGTIRTTRHARYIFSEEQVPAEQRQEFVGALHKANKLAWTGIKENGVKDVFVHHFLGSWGEALDAYVKRHP